MSLIESIKKSFSFEDEYEGYQDGIDGEEEIDEKSNVIKPSFFKRKEKEGLKALPKINHLPEETGQALNIVKPERFEDSMSIVNDLKDGKIIVLNTNQMEMRQAQRLLDFVSGASFALNGDIQEVMESIYVLSPAGVSMKNSARNESTVRSLFGLK